MTTNKPEITCWGSFYKGVMQDFGYNEEATKSAAKLDFHGRKLSIEPLVRLSDYQRLQAETERLQAECEKLRKDAERYHGIVAAVLREHPHRNHNRGNAPGHGHSVPGVWDYDNGALAGKECAWCKAWNEALAAMQENKP